MRETNHVIHRIEIYPVDSYIQRLNNLGQDKLCAMDSKSSKKKNLHNHVTTVILSHRRKALFFENINQPMTTIFSLQSTIKKKTAHDPILIRFDRILSMRWRQKAIKPSALMYSWTP